MNAQTTINYIGQIAIIIIVMVGVHMKIIPSEVLIAVIGSIVGHGVSIASGYPKQHKLEERVSSVENVTKDI